MSQQPLTIGSLFIVAAPSGAGKSSLVAELLKTEPNLHLSVSHTTRAPRAGEVDGVHYHFVDGDAFATTRVADGFIEWAQVHDYCYGTPRAQVAQMLHAGKDVLLEIDWQGAQQVRVHFPDAVGIFILPPSMTELQNRLEKRDTDTPTVIQTRLSNAKAEIAHADEFDYVIINTTFSTALTELQHIVHAGRLRFARQLARHRAIFADLT